MSYSVVLSEIYDQTLKMLELAQSSCWDELIEAEQKREQLLNKLVMFSPEEKSQNDDKKKLQEIIELNKVITSISLQEKSENLKSFKNTKQSRKAKLEYQRY